MVDLRANISRDDGLGEADDVKLAHSSRIILIAGALLLIGLGWAYFARLDEVTTGNGRVVPTMREQVIQTLQGGILAELYVRQDEIVEADQILAQLDPTQTESELEENASRYRASLARSARLTAEVDGTELKFSDELKAFPELIRAETDLYNSRLDKLKDTQSWLDEAMTLAKRELDINVSLNEIGASSNVEVIRLRRQLVDLELKRGDVQAEYTVQAREELSKANGEVQSLSSTVRGGSDSLQRLTIRSPVRGIVKNIEVTTRKGVIPPNGKLMEIVPLDDQLLIEARISPRDVAFIHVDQAAKVKVTAYDYAIYGSLNGVVTSISADTIRDETNASNYYYRVFVKTSEDALENKIGERFPITPGMVATVDIQTGNKSVLEYLIKPFNKVGEALRER
jgi:adhesin transport system membrane fusion protein